MERLPNAALQLLVCFGDDGGVFLVIRILGPAIKKEIVVGDFAGFIPDADRTGVAHPAAIGGHAEKLQGIEICSRVFQDGSDAGLGRTIFDKEIDALDLGQVPDNFGESPRNDRKFPGPIGYLMRPAEPGGFVRFPLGGHVKAE